MRRRLSKRRRRTVSRRRRGATRRRRVRGLKIGYRM